jgi:hypothetical protein
MLAPVVDTNAKEEVMVIKDGQSRKFRFGRSVQFILCAPFEANFLAPFRLQVAPQHSNSRPCCDEQKRTRALLKVKSLSEGLPARVLPAHSFWKLVNFKLLRRKSFEMRPSVWMGRTL